MVYDDPNVRSMSVGVATLASSGALVGEDVDAAVGFGHVDHPAAIDEDRRTGLARPNIRTAAVCVRYDIAPHLAHELPAWHHPQSGCTNSDWQRVMAASTLSGDPRWPSHARSAASAAPVAQKSRTHRRRARGPPIRQSRGPHRRRWSRPLAGSDGRPALTRLRESSRCLLAAQSAAACKHTSLSLAWRSGHLGPRRSLLVRTDGRSVCGDRRRPCSRTSKRKRGSCINGIVARAFRRRRRRRRGPPPRPRTDR